VTNARPWLSLLRRLTDAVPTWGVWKRPDSALEGEGDVDSLGSESDWKTIVAEYRSWAEEHGLGPVVVCRHAPDLLVLAACEGEGPTRLLQMDVYAHQVFRGARLASADDLHGLMRLDPRGFRRLRPGAEGVLLLLAEGVRRGGRPPSTVAAEGIAGLLREDPEGAEQAAAALGPRGRHVLAAARALADGRWNRPELVSLELKSAARLLFPRELARCFARDARGLRPCDLMKALEAERLVPGDRDRWLAEVGRSHAVYRSGDA